MDLLSFVHPIRTYQPCSGVGRHANNVLLRLAQRESIQQKLFFSEEWLEQDGKMNRKTPLRRLPARTFPYPENLTERCWKIFGRPRMDQFVPDGTELIYAPVETYLPVEKWPVAITIHDIQAFETDLPWSQTWAHRWFRWKWSTWIYDALDDCAVVFTVSEFSKSRMVELLGADPNDIVVVGNGVDARFFEIAEQPRDELDRPCKAPYLFMIGGLRKKKGADAMLSVARELERQGSDVQLVVAGPNGEEYEEEADDLDNIQLLGWVDDEHVPSLMRGSLALLFLSPYEGFGLPAAEAMAAGTPAIVADRASLPEVVGDAGIVVEPGETERIVEHVRSLRHNAARRRQYVDAGRDRAQRYTWGRCVDRLVETFERIAA
ncbi:glycosyltransferase family 4 protein [Salinibacter ruber]|uniref:glycosyltransferase family 4 protein n=1 Tax=Salinibacter ruber TaxID=146919 RepID=UPI00216A4E65|nr:glycosyltransferase family 1 protein [Salinibacter ruber]MCS3824346.1 glycosyltransferase involved in cell wall biosynthesis [Salinibacter ruber]